MSRQPYPILGPPRCVPMSAAVGVGLLTSTYDSPNRGSIRGRQRIPMRFGSLLAVFLLSVLSSCSGISSGRDAGPVTSGPEPVRLQGKEQVAAANLQRAYLSSGFLTVDTDAEAKCLATRIVDRLGLRSMVQYGMLGKDLTANLDYGGDLAAKDAEAHADVLLICIEYSALVREMVASADMQESEEYVQNCVRAVTEDEVRDAWAALFSGNSYHDSAYARNLERAGCSYEGD